MKKKNRKIVFSILRNTIDRLIPKKKTKVVLYSSTGVLDPNLICVKQYLDFFYPELEVNILFGKRKRTIKQSFKFMNTFFTSYYIIVDHALPRFITNNRRKIYNVWHGIPLKNIRHLDRSRFTKAFLDFESNNLDGLACSSELDRAVMSSCFNIEPDKCILSGLPRADILSPADLKWFSDPQQLELKELLQGKKLIAWMPTYRGTWHQKNKIEAFSHNDEVMLLALLEKHDALLGVRPHKFSNLQEFPLLEEKSRIVDLSVFELCNSVLKYTDYLITDYSSVWLDYSLISENISLYLFDSEDYDVERGMIYPLNEVFKGSISVTFMELYSDIDINLSANRDKFKINPLFFKYSDNNNTKRFVERVFNAE